MASVWNSCSCSGSWEWAELLFLSSLLACHANSNNLKCNAIHMLWRSELCIILTALNTVNTKRALQKEEHAISVRKTFTVQRLISWTEKVWLRERQLTSEMFLPSVHLFRDGYADLVQWASLCQEAGRYNPSLSRSLCRSGSVSCLHQVSLSGLM